MTDSAEGRVRDVVGITDQMQIVEGFEFQIMEFYRQWGVTEHFFLKNSNMFSSMFQEANFENMKEEKLERRDNRSRETN